MDSLPATQQSNILLKYIKKPEELSIISKEAKNLAIKYYSERTQIILLETTLVRILKAKKKVKSPALD